MSKGLDENYRAGRTAVWLKSKCRPGQEIVVGGWRTSPAGHFKGLLAGVYDDGQLVYAGSVKNGFGERQVRDVLPRLKALQRPRSPFRGWPQPTATGGDGLHFAGPRLVAQADIAEWTASGKLRQASFEGLREDKPPETVRRERPCLPAAAARSTRGRVGEQTHETTRHNRSSCEGCGGGMRYQTFGNLQTRAMHAGLVMSRDRMNSLIRLRFRDPDASERVWRNLTFESAAVIIETVETADVAARAAPAAPGAPLPGG